MHIKYFKRGGAIVSKIKLFLRNTFKLPRYILAIPAVLLMRLVRPLLLVRVGDLISNRIGHFACNTELYLCERDAGINVPNQNYIDLFYMYEPFCNQQLALMWKRELRIWPSWILGAIDRVNLFIPGGDLHVVGQNTQNDRDVHNLLGHFPPHLQFTTEEENRGESGLRAMGMPMGVQFVCLIVRDSAYLDTNLAYGNYEKYNYHNFRDCDVQNFVLASEELAERGYFVIRMGVKVHSAINSTHPKVLNYASNGLRSDFMDIYLGAKCSFCISVGTGFDAVPLIFRRPIVYVNMVPVGYFFTFVNKILGNFKHHIDTVSNRELSLSEILSCGLGFSLKTSDYEKKGVDLIENTPEEIRDVAIEMVERLNDTWQEHPEEESQQQRFWEIFPSDAVDHNGKMLHGEIFSRFGSTFLRDNPDWLK